ncbi:MAG: hemin ABC transporter substrate-binding protein, partial [Myxococcota bacterium]
MVTWMVLSTLSAAQWYGTPPASPKRVLSLAPSITETVIALEASETLVGVSRFDEAPQVQD